jgi:hypothetical protein
VVTIEVVTPQWQSVVVQDVEVEDLFAAQLHDHVASGDDLTERGEGVATFKGKGESDGQTTVTARLMLAHYNLRDRNPAWHDADTRLVQHLRHLGEVLRLPPGAPV